MIIPAQMAYFFLLCLTEGFNGPLFRAHFEFSR